MSRTINNKCNKELTSSNYCRDARPLPQQKSLCVNIMHCMNLKCNVKQCQTQSISDGNESIEIAYFLTEPLRAVSAVSIGRVDEFDSGVLHLSSSASIFWWTSSSSCTQGASGSLFEVGSWSNLPTSELSRLVDVKSKKRDFCCCC